MLLLLDIGNTHTHLGWANQRRVVRHKDVPTSRLLAGDAEALIRDFVGECKPSGTALCSVVPRATPVAKALVEHCWRLPCLELTARTVTGIGIDYPLPQTIGADRLANAIALRRHFGAPSVAVAFGTALAFDVVNGDGNYAGGIIAPGLSAMTDYLHEKTALLPRVHIRDTEAVIGKTTREAMLIGAVHGYRGMVRELIRELRRELKCRRLPVVATGGYAALIAARVPEITAVEPWLTLEGLRLAWWGGPGDGA